METLLNMAGSKLVFRQTNAKAGRNLVVDEVNSPMKFLRYGRIVLDSEVNQLSFDTECYELGLICLSGIVEARVEGETFTLGRYDALYLPPGTQVELSTDSHADIVECGALVTGNYPVQFVSYKEVAQNPAQKFVTGASNSTRTINILLGKNISAGRILAGVTQSEPGHWTSWPPHEHGEMLEEIYVYYDMPAPAFGIQFVYNNPTDPELAVMVRDGDAVLMPSGFHPNVAIPGHPINFVWLMAAHREGLDRQFGVVNVQPGLEGSGSGLEASLK